MISPILFSLRCPQPCPSDHLFPKLRSLQLLNNQKDDFHTFILVLPVQDNIVFLGKASPLDGTNGSYRLKTCFTTTTNGFKKVELDLMKLYYIETPTCNCMSNRTYISTIARFTGRRHTPVRISHNTLSTKLG
jgi:hypothetical protein